MTKTQLIKWSVARDALNFIVIGQIPGLNWLLDLPLIIMHFNYAGPAAAVTLLEMIPVIGFFPFFSVAAMLYPNNDDSPPPTGVRVTRAYSPQLPHVASTAPLYAMVDGELVPVVMPEVVDAEAHLVEPRQFPLSVEQIALQG